MKTDTLKKLFRYAKRYTPLFVLSVVFATVTVITTLYLPILTGNAIDYILEPGKVQFDMLIPILKTGIVVMGITAVSQWLMNTCNNKMTYGIVRDVRKDAFDKLEILPLKYVDTHSHGEIVSKIIADVDQFAEGLLLGFTQLFSGIVTILCTLFFMIRLNWVIAIVVVVITPLSLFTASFIAKKTFNMFKEQSVARGEQTAFVNEMIENQKEKYGWEFLFLGANIDAISVAAGIGINEERAVTYEADGEGTRKNFEAVCYAASCIRENKPSSAINWKEKIERYRDKKQR